MNEFFELCPEEFRKHVGAWTVYFFQDRPISVDFSVSDNPNFPRQTGKVWCDIGSKTYRYKVWDYNNGDTVLVTTSRERLLSKISR